MDKILLHGIRLNVHVGVPEEERSRPQQILLDVDMAYDTHRAGVSDDVADTVDYSAVHRTLVRVATERSYLLIEAMAERMAAAVLAGFPVAEVRLRLKKPEAMRDRGVDYPAVEIVRGRHG
jgi:7,8-dihydroneopterin aldolase/epimerase/oxygenase